MDVCRIKQKSSNGDGVSTMVDLNDVFDDIVLAENNSFHRGFQEGVEKSRAEGFADGFGLGLGKGLQVPINDQWVGVGLYRRVLFFSIFPKIVFALSLYWIALHFHIEYGLSGIPLYHVTTVSYVN